MQVLIKLEWNVCQVCDDTGVVTGTIVRRPCYCCHTWDTKAKFLLINQDIVVQENKVWT